MKSLITKIKLQHIITPIIAFITPIKSLILIVGIFILLDTITGIYKSIKKKIPITSRRFSSVVSKMVLYEFSVILFFAIEKFILGDFILLFTSIPLFLTKLIAIILIGIEITSINENYKEINGISLWDRIKELLKRVKKAKSELDEFEDILPKK